MIRLGFSESDDSVHSVLRVEQQFPPPFLRPLLSRRHGARLLLPGLHAQVRLTLPGGTTENRTSDQQQAAGGTKASDRLMPHGKHDRMKEPGAH